MLRVLPPLHALRRFLCEGDHVAFYAAAAAAVVVVVVVVAVV